MTLILAALGHTFVVVGADRRLSDNGRIVEEESTKLTVLVTPDARAVVGYTGIARAGTFNTELWLLETLSAASRASPDGTSPDLHPILEGLRSRAEIEIGKIAGAIDARLTLLVVGFLYRDATTEPWAWKITNWEHSSSGVRTPEFQTISYAPSTQNLVSAGNIEAVAKTEIASLEELLRNGVPAIGLEQKIHDVIRKTSLSLGSGNTVGAQCNVCTVMRDTTQKIAATYYSENVTHKMYSVNTAFPGMITSGALLEAAGGLPPAVVPKRGRNEPCPCGIGQKYKKCHGALAYPYRPLVVIQRYDKPPYPASQLIFVESKGAARR
jgi:hypothetical protein